MRTFLLASLCALEKPTTGLLGFVDTAWQPTETGAEYCPGPGSPAATLAAGSTNRGPPFSVRGEDAFFSRLPPTLYADGPVDAHQKLFLFSHCMLTNSSSF